MLEVASSIHASPDLLYQNYILIWYSVSTSTGPPKNMYTQQRHEANGGHFHHLRLIP